MDWLISILGVFAVLVVALWTWNVIAARIYRSRLANAYRNFASAGEVPQLPSEVRELVTTFQEFGFEPLTSHLTHDGRLVILLFNESEGSIGEIVDLTDLEGVERLTTEFTSILEEGRGLLCTGNTAVPSIHVGELRQTFLGASLDELVRHHRAAVQQLRDQGLDTRPISSDEAILSREEWFELQQEQIRTASTRMVVDWIRDARGGHSVSSGPVAENPRMRARLHAILGSR